MNELKKLIKTYAFVHQCDLDKATYVVLWDLVNDCKLKRASEGLYDRLFGEETENK